MEIYSLRNYIRQLAPLAVGQSRESLNKSPF